MPSSLRREQQAATRQRLLKAAYDAFLSGGFDATTIDDIVTAAGTSRATFYLHFRSKADALAGTWNELDLPDVAQLMREHDAGQDFSTAATRRWLTRMLDYWTEHAAVATAANQAMAAEPELQRTWVSNMASTAEAMPNLVAHWGGDAKATDRLLLLAIQLERAAFFWIRGDIDIAKDRFLSALTREWASPEA
jgi:AcrR family transcriptional regulator